MWLGPMGAIIVTGIPGVGKTTVMEAAAEKAAAQIVVYGSEMFTVASDKGLVEHRDDMRKLDPAIQKEVQMAAAEADEGVHDDADGVAGHVTEVGVEHHHQHEGEDGDGEEAATALRGRGVGHQLTTGRIWAIASSTLPSWL